jgi:sulfide:quinone oxidoreductase
MQARKLTETYTVAPQILATDLPAIVAEGYRSIMCNRPDGESADQPPYSEIATAAAAHGLPARHVPVVSGMITPADVEAFKTGVRLLPLWRALHQSLAADRRLTLCSPMPC